MKLYERIENNNFDEIDKDRTIELIENGNGHLIYNENYFKLQEELKELRKENEELKKDFYNVINKIEKKEILDEKEKEYLNNVIKPFREKVTYIQKDSNRFNRLKEFIRIGIKNDAEITLPYFEIDTMYKGMKIYKKYTLSELGLEE